MKPSFRFATVALLAISVPSFSQEQAVPGTQDQAPQPGYTMHQDVRLVLEDVTVIDANGNVVPNLPASAFHITDNGQPQNIRNFEEHKPTPSAIFKQASTPANGTYSNAPLQHMPPVLNIIVLDTARLSIMDQVYLNYELKSFFKQQPEGEPFALYFRDVGSTVLLQDFTSDYQVLLAAAARVLPRMRPLGPQPMPAIETLRQLAIEVGQIPGRKNVLWFTGRLHNLDFVRTNPEGDVYFDHDGDLDQARYVYDMLEATRIAVYPIDARGLTTDGLSLSGSTERMNSAFSLDEVATATGGLAFYNNNALDHIADHIVKSDQNFYSLTFSPNNFQADHKWHNVKVTLNYPGYRLSYRRGYFADSARKVSSSIKDCERCQSGSEKHRANRIQTDLQLPPILFNVSVLPADATPPDPSDSYLALKTTGAPQKKGTIPYIIRYTLPGDAFSTEVVDGKSKAAFDLGVLALNQDGDPVAVKGDQVSAKFPVGQTNQPIKISQIVDLKPGDLFVYIAVWDSGTGRIGTIQVPVKVAKASLHHAE